jgi:hypothetical protein
MRNFKVRCIQTFPMYKKKIDLNFLIWSLFSTFFIINILFHIKTPSFLMIFIRCITFKKSKGLRFLNEFKSFEMFDLKSSKAFYNMQMVCNTHGSKKHTKRKL